MGLDISLHAERHVGDAYVNMPVDHYWHDTYEFYGFLGDRRNWSDVPSPFSGRGLPKDMSETTEMDLWNLGSGSSWATVQELSEFDYDGKFLDTDENVVTTFREHLGPRYFAALDSLVRSGAERVVWSFG